MQTLIDILCQWIGMLPLECLQMHFMQEAFIGILLCAPLAAAAGTQVVNFRMTFFSDAIGHSAFAGVALGLICSIPPDFSMQILAVLIGIAIMILKRSSTLSSDTVIGVLFSAVVALGLAFASRNPNMAKDMQMFLYGDILTISRNQIVMLFILSILFYVFEIFAFNRMIAIGMNEQLARTHRIKVAAYEYAHIILLSLVVICCVRAVGVLLVTALLIVPAASARNISRTSCRMFWLSIAIGIFCGIAGLLISAQEWAQTAAGASIVLTACLIFLCTFAYNRIRKFFAEN